MYIFTFIYYNAAGDALLCIWKVSPRTATNEATMFVEEETASIPDIQSALRMARRAAYDMLKEIKEYCADLELHGGIGSGSLLQFHLGSDGTATGGYFFNFS